MPYKQTNKNTISTFMKCAMVSMTIAYQVCTQSLWLCSMCAESVHIKIHRERINPNCPHCQARETIIHFKCKIWDTFRPRNNQFLPDEKT